MQPTTEKLASIRTIDLTTIGRRSGQRHRIEIWWFHEDGRFIITGSPGRRDWYANVLADPRVSIHVDEHDLDAIALPIEDPEERRRLFRASRFDWYRTQAELEELVEGSPMVEIRIGQRELGNPIEM